ncbi:MAG: ABC transporter ATP-binding protein [Candidatus Omnitrophota bacterium]|nr:MAG: ABC transporter ATP-binding protein [Candidatus Omnitrophota bacterium]
MLGIVGESGCGKTMTGLSLTNLLPDSKLKIESGKIIFAGEDIVSLDEAQLRALRGKEIAYVFQEPATALNPVLTIGEQIREVVKLHCKHIPKDAINGFIIEHLEDVGIHLANEKLNVYAHQLSGGEKQRIMLCMAVIARPKLLIADEPTTAVDVTIQSQIIKLLHKLKKEYGLSIFLISHNLAVVADLSDYIGVMYAGRIVEFAKAGIVLEKPLHPYTQGLLNCLPELQTGRGFKSINGEVPKFDNLPSGCSFSPRCVKAQKRCFLKMPPMFKTALNQEVRCWLYSGS